MLEVDAKFILLIKWLEIYDCTYLMAFDGISNDTQHVYNFFLLFKKNFLLDLRMVPTLSKLIFVNPKCQPFY